LLRAAQAAAGEEAVELLSDGLGHGGGAGHHELKRGTLKGKRVGWASWFLVLGYGQWDSGVMIDRNVNAWSVGHGGD
jgi:hypothetical protein